LNGGLTVQPVNVTVRSMAAASCSIEPLQKRLPGGLKVGRLKTLCMRAFGLDTERQVLHFRAEVRYDTKSANARTKSPTLQPTFVYTSLSSLQDDPFPIELDDDEHTLSYYGVCDGADILMNEVDLVARQRDEARMVEEHNQRLTEQERDARALQELQRTESKVRTLAIEKAAQSTG
jgi:Ubiquitin-like domain